MNDSQSLNSIEFARPPVAEVSISVTFLPLDRLRTFEILEIWNELFKDELPSYQLVAPLIPQVEQFGAPGAQPQMKVQFLSSRPNHAIGFLTNRVRILFKFNKIGSQETGGR